MGNDDAACKRFSLDTVQRVMVFLILVESWNVLGSGMTSMGACFSPRSLAKNHAIKIEGVLV